MCEADQVLFQLPRQESSFSVSLSFTSWIGAEKYLLARVSLLQNPQWETVYSSLTTTWGSPFSHQDKNCLSASKNSCNGRNRNLNPFRFTGERRKLPFHLVAQDKGLSAVPRRAGTGKVLYLQHLSRATVVLCTQHARPETGAQTPFTHRVAPASLSLTSQSCHPLQKQEYSFCLQCLLTWVITATGFLGMVLMDRSQGSGCWQEKGATPSECGCWLQKCWGLSICSQPLAELCLVKSLVPVTQRKGAAEPLCPEGCGTSSKEGRGLHLHREGARHLHLWNSSGGELTDVNLLQMPNLLLALDLFFFFFHQCSVSLKNA